MVYLKQTNIYFCFIDYAKAFDCVDHNKLWKITKEMGIPDNLTWLLRNLYAGQEATVRTGKTGKTDWFWIGKAVCHGCILSPCLFNLYAELNSVKSLSRVGLFVTLWTAAQQASLSITNCRSPPNVMSLTHLDYMQSTSWEMKHKLESRLPGEILIASNMKMTSPFGRKWRGSKKIS